MSAFVYLVGLKEFTSGRDDTKHIQACYWLPLQRSGTVCVLIGWGPCGSQPKSVMLLLGWSHSVLLPVWVPRDRQQGSRAPCPAGCLRASPCLTPSCSPYSYAKDPSPWVLAWTLRLVDVNQGQVTTKYPHTYSRTILSLQLLLRHYWARYSTTNYPVANCRRLWLNGAAPSNKCVELNMNQWRAEKSIHAESALPGK